MYFTVPERSVVAVNLSRLSVWRARPKSISATESSSSRSASIAFVVFRSW